MKLKSAHPTPTRTAICALTLVLLGASGAAMAATVNPNTATSLTPAAQSALRQGVVMQAATLTSIKQVPYTDQGTETWIEVQGSGHCNFTIESAGVATQSFASSAAKPFPVKVKIMGAPLGSHLWIAKGTGNCTGMANTTFSVNG